MAAYLQSAFTTSELQNLGYRDEKAEERWKICDPNNSTTLGKVFLLKLPPCRMKAESGIGSTRKNLRTMGTTDGAGRSSHKGGSKSRYTAEGGQSVAMRQRLEV
jgi:hypothetical protein